MHKLNYKLPNFPPPVPPHNLSNTSPSQLLIAAAEFLPVNLKLQDNRNCDHFVHDSYLKTWPAVSSSLQSILSQQVNMDKIPPLPVSLPLRNVGTLKVSTLQDYVKENAKTT